MFILEWGAKIVALVIGILAMRMMFMYEDKEGVWQDAATKLWMSADDKATKSGRESLQFFGRVAGVTSKTLNRVFGDRLLSLQFVGVSTAYACASSLWSVPLVIYLGKIHGRTESGAQRLFYFEQFCISVGVVCFVLAFLPSFFQPQHRRLSNFLSVVALFPTFAIALAALRVSGQNSLLVMLVALGLTCFLDLLWTIWVRSTLRKLSAEPSTMRVGLAALLQPLFMAFVVVVPFVLSGPYRPMVAPNGYFFFAESLFNVSTAVASALFLMTLILVLVDRAIWPILAQLVYPLGRYDLVKNKRFLFVVAAVCFLFACPGLYKSLKDYLDWLVKLV